MRIAFSSAALHGVSPADAVTGVGADLIGFSGAAFFPLFTGRGGGGAVRVPGNYHLPGML